MSNLPKPLQKIAATEDARMAVGVAWLVVVPVCTLAGFYLMTIIGSAHVIDLQLPDIVRGAWGAVGGFLIGVIGATLVTVLYPSVVLAEEQSAVHENAHLNPTEP